MLSEGKTCLHRAIQEAEDGRNAAGPNAAGHLVQVAARPNVASHRVPVAVLPKEAGRNEASPRVPATVPSVAPVAAHPNAEREKAPSPDGRSFPKPG
jgi:hypothetical protein